MAPLTFITKQLISVSAHVPIFKQLSNPSGRLINTVLIRKMSSVRKIINADKAPKAIGPYSQAVLVDKTLYISGQLGMDSASGNLVGGGVEAQARKALENMGCILEAAGGNYGSVVKATVLLKDMNDFAAVNSVYAEFFKDKYPARAAYQVAALPKGGLVEIEAVAVIGAAHL